MTFLPDGLLSAQENANKTYLYSSIVQFVRVIFVLVTCVVVLSSSGLG